MKTTNYKEEPERKRKLYLIGDPAVREKIRDLVKTFFAFFGLAVVIVLAMFGALSLGYLIMIYNGG